jgi:hypothetical protein
LHAELLHQTEGRHVSWVGATNDLGQFEVDERVLQGGGGGFGADALSPAPA